MASTIDDNIFLPTRRRLSYEACNIAANGVFVKTSNCSVTATVVVSGKLNITGVLLIWA